MTIKRFPFFSSRCRATSFCIIVLAGFAFAAVSVQAQDPAIGQVAATGGVGESQLVTMQATVQELNRSERTATLVGPQGDRVKVKVGPEVKNFDQVQTGDTVVVRFYDSVVYVIAPAGYISPDDRAAAAGATTAGDGALLGPLIGAVGGALPRAAIAEKTIVRGAVVGVDPTANTISLVDPAGGKVRTFTVKDGQNQSMLGLVSVGDTVTVYLTDAIAVQLQLLPGEPTTPPSPF